jgi:transcriptional regulator with XRE-family HTH domain
MPGQKRSEEWKREVGRRLRAVRLAAGYETARQFAQAIGIEENTLTSWERGERLIEPENLADIRDLAGVTSDYIYYNDPSALPSNLAKALKVDTS